MSKENKIEELEKKCAELSRSKNKAKVAYFKMKKESEEHKEAKDLLNSEKSKLQIQVADLTTQNTTLASELKQKDAIILGSLKKIEEFEYTIAKMEEGSSKTSTESKGFQQEINDLESVIALKCKQETIHLDTIKDLRKKHTEDHQTIEELENQNKKRKLEDRQIKNVLEFRIMDLTKKRDSASRAYTDMETKYKQLQAERETNVLNEELENKITSLTNSLNDKQISLENVIAAVTPMDSILKALKADLDDIKKITSGAGLNSMISTLTEMRVRVMDHFGIEDASDSPSVSESSDQTSSQSMGTIQENVSNLSRKSNATDDMARQILGEINEVIRLCNVESEQQVVIRTRAKYLDAKFANFEYEMVALTNHQTKSL